MTDDELLRRLLQAAHPEAAPWNLSPEQQFAAYVTRAMLRRHVAPRGDVCNIGIGNGEWDDFLGYWLADRGRLTSVDIDPDIVATLRHRQRRAAHPYPADAVCEDLLAGRLPRRAFALVTLIGSTLHEIGAYEGALDACFELVEPGGVLFYADFDAFHPPARFVEYAARSRRAIVTQRGFTGNELIDGADPDAALYIFLASDAGA